VIERLSFGGSLDARTMGIRVAPPTKTRMELTTEFTLRMSSVIVAPAVAACGEPPTK